MCKVAPSILSADFKHLGRDIDTLKKNGADYVHFDVMDGIFVPNISFGLPVLESVRQGTDMVLDVHLMIDRPIRYVERFCRAGADIVTVHVEADSQENTRAALELIRGCGKRAAVCVKPKTPAEAVLPFLDLCSMVLVMTVEPGFGGQSFMADMMPKVKAIRRYIEARCPGCELEVDGGVSLTTGPVCAEAGADLVTVHVESDTEVNTHEALDKIHAKGKRAGVVLKPKTPAEAVLPFLREVELVLVMTVEPGFGGQKFMADMMPKVSAIRRWIDEQNPGCELEVDGGVDPVTCKTCIAAGANVLVAGSAVYKAADIPARIAELRG